jgi:Kdo2-lipid IVA lauroyltransferase/acyltransferase
MQINLSSFLQWKVNILLCQKLGWHFAFFYIMMLGNLYFLIKRTEKKKIKEAVNIVFSEKEGPPAKETLIRDIFRGILYHYYEKIFNVYTSPENLKSFFNRHIKPEGISAIEQGLARGKGVLLITGHFGGIEYIPTYLAVRKYPITIMVKFSSNHLRKISNELAIKLGFKIIDTNNCLNIVKAIIHDLKENRIVITQCDEIEEWRPSSKEEIFFLGKRIYLDKTINTLARRVDATFVFGIMRRINRQEYKFIARSSEEILEAFGKTTYRSVGETVLKYFEQYIYHHPEEWYQWKKVSKINMDNFQTIPETNEKSPIWLRPVFEKSQ